jgi:hypothetical protein
VGEWVGIKTGQGAAAAGATSFESCAVRVKPHTDPTDITILAFEEGPNGLQVC